MRELENQRPKNQRPKNQRPKNQRPKNQRPKNQRPKNQRPKNQRPENQRPENQIIYKCWFNYINLTSVPANGTVYMYESLNCLVYILVIERKSEL